MTSQPVHKPDEVRRFWMQRHNVLNVSPVFDLFFQSTYCYNWMNNLHQELSILLDTQKIFLFCIS